VRESMQPHIDGHWFLAPAPLLIVALLASTGVFLLLAGLPEHQRIQRIAIELLLMIPAILCLLRYKSRSSNR
jgi:hypothetical protein